MRKTTSKLIRCYTLLFLLLAATNLSVIYAQEANSDTSLVIKNSKLEYNINKLTTDEALETIKKEINERNVALLNFSEVHRNERGELISITTSFKDNRNNRQKKSEYNSSGISPFSVIIHENEQGNRYLEITSDQNFFYVKNGQAYLREDESKKENGYPSPFYQPDLSAEELDLIKKIEEDILKQQETLFQVMDKYTEKGK